MTSYYYLIASLPDLRVEDEMPMSYIEFLKLCETTVSESSYQILENLSLNSDKGPLIEGWAKAYGKLTKELNYQRSMNLGKNYAAVEDKDYITAQVVSNALAAKNPLEAEKILMSYEFDLLDSLVGMHMFDDHVLFGYAIKLKLMERQSCFDHAKGKAEFKSLFDQVQQRVYSL